MAAVICLDMNGGQASTRLCEVSEERPWNSRVNNRDASGLLIHHLSGTDTYVRVGVWTSMVEDGGGTALFQDIDVQEIEIV